MTWWHNLREKNYTIPSLCTLGIFHEVERGEERARRRDRKLRGQDKECGATRSHSLSRRSSKQPNAALRPNKMRTVKHPLHWATLKENRCITQYMWFAKGKRAHSAKEKVKSRMTCVIWDACMWFSYPWSSKLPESNPTTMYLIPSLKQVWLHQNEVSSFPEPPGLWRPV